MKLLSLLKESAIEEGKVELFILLLGPELRDVRNVLLRFYTGRCICNFEATGVAVYGEISIDGSIDFHKAKMEPAFWLDHVA